MYIVSVDNMPFQSHMINVFLFFHKNKCCRYSLEAPREGASNEYHNVYFREEIRRNVNMIFYLSWAIQFCVFYDLFTIDYDTNEGLFIKNIKGSLFLKNRYYYYLRKV